MKFIARFFLCVLMFSFFDQSSFNVKGAAIWRSPPSGFWRIGTNWNGGQPPNLALGGTYITNATAKTVTVEALTATSNLFINALNLWVPGNATNTLLLSD